MSEWIEGSQDFGITTTQSIATPIEIFQNNSDPFVRRTIVDGYVFILTDTDDLCQVRLLGPMHNVISSGDFSFTTPGRHEAVSWYWLGCGRGPVIYRIRSKRTFNAEDELWIMGVKLRGSVLTQIKIGWQFLLSP